MTIVSMAIMTIITALRAQIPRRKQQQRCSSRGAVGCAERERKRGGAREGGVEGREEGWRKEGGGRAL